MRWSVPIVLVTILLSLSACGTNTAVNSYCTLAFPIWHGEGDSEETLRQVDQHNATFDAVCQKEKS